MKPQEKASFYYYFTIPKSSKAKHSTRNRDSIKFKIFEDGGNGGPGEWEEETFY